MAYSLRAQITLEGLISYTTSAAAALRATAGLEGLAQPFEDRKLALRTARDARDDARDAVLAASRVVQIRDAEWDDVVKDLSGRAYLAAGKDAGKAPYAQLFGSITAKVACGLGPAKATDVGERIVRTLREQNHAELNAHVARLEAANASLRDAAATRSNAQREAQAHEIKRSVAKDELELLIAQTELGILTTFVGRADLVRAILAPERAATASDDDIGITDLPS